MEQQYVDYPHMLYKDGKVGDDWVIVADPGEEAAAGKNGYSRADNHAEKAAAKRKGS